MPRSRAFRAYGRHGWSTPPRYIDWDHPATRGLLAFWIPSHPLGVYSSPIFHDLVGRNDGISGNGSSSLTAPTMGTHATAFHGYQPGADFDAGDCIRVAPADVHDFNADHSGFVDYATDSVTTGTLVGKRDVSDADFQIYFASSVMRVNIGGTLPSIVDPATTGAHCMAWRKTTATVYGYEDGAAGSSGTAGTPSGSTVPVLLGARYGGEPTLAYQLNGRIFAAALWDRDIGADLARWLSAGKWTDLIWQRRRTFFVPAAAPAGGIKPPSGLTLLGVGA